MAHKIIWSPEAVEDLDSIAEYIGKDSPGYAGNVVGKVFDIATEIIHFPEAGRIVPELSDPGIRERFVYSYRVIYKINTENICIIAILHGKRLVESVEERFGV
ncbi:MAG TPA: type II toxin-antitoxin system RelE/ParE family toxin [Candidatus Ozemobacteraceae bacterium]|nr:type II toxin-antitoxin system RelE/ParE family toxin [Candidatus Ozemobacteraceae bacterium]